MRETSMDSVKNGTGLKENLRKVGERTKRDLEVAADSLFENIGSLCGNLL